MPCHQRRIEGSNRGDGPRRRGGVVSHPVNLGAGAAAQTGFRYAVRRGYDVVIQIDADGQHDPRDVPALLQVLGDEGVDAAIGSRFLEDRGYRPTRMRSIGMLFFNGLATILTGQRVTDSTSCFRALKRPVFKFFAEMDYPTDFQDADLRVLMKRAGFRVREVPVSMRPRLGGRLVHQRDRARILRLQGEPLHTRNAPAGGPRPRRE